MRALIGIAVGLAACRADATEPVCKRILFEDVAHIVCDVARDARISLHLRGEDGETLGRFDAVAAQLDGPALMMMNGGMYHADRAPVGLYIEDGDTVTQLVTQAGPGNFGLLPNGVFWNDGERAHVTETLAFDATDAEPDFATQSGPMLVIDGALHPRFLPDSDSRKRRNGVGIAGERVVFAISDAPVTFYHFGRLFRDALGADNALYLDGSISRIRAPELGRDEGGGMLGPVIALTAEPDRP
ncbi:phosphodiester glycosidase family protein [uncultured Algimonas sp.]|uniref:phosphodiester glycosidase family protein n=1 Tax=uncultured Algimonas sp. TaxID=1547920 RepID=UPI0026176C6E|nr:phosphodiester glycosidase family protein [uncultured Algimonas sp.]